MATKTRKPNKTPKRSPNKAAKPTTAKPTKAKPTKAKPTKAKPTTAKPTKAKPTTAKPTKAKSAKPAKSIYDDYLGNVAANVRPFGLPRALEICVDMFVYEFQLELKKLKQAAIAQLAARDFAPVIAAAKANRISPFTEADAETMLRGLAQADDHFEPIQE